MAGGARHERARSTAGALRQRPGGAPHRRPGAGARARAASPTTCRPPGQVSPALPALAACARAHRGDRRARPRGACPACWRSTPAPSSRPPASSRCRWRPASSAPTASRWPRRRDARWRIERVRYVGEAVAAVVAETRDAARAAADAVMRRLRRAARGHRRRCAALAARRAGAVADGAPDNVAAEMRHGDAAAAERARSRAPRTASRWTSSTSAWRRRRSSRASVLAELDAERPADACACRSQMPTGVRAGLADALPGLTTENVRVRGRRRRRRLRHEDRHLPGGHRGRLRRACS